VERVRERGSLERSNVGANLDGVLTMITDPLRSPLSPTLSPEGAREEKAA